MLRTPNEGPHKGDRVALMLGTPYKGPHTGDRVARMWAARS